MKPILNAPGTKRLNLQYDEALSNVAFKFNLRRYIKALYATDFAKTDAFAEVMDSAPWRR